MVLQPLVDGIESRIVPDDPGDLVLPVYLCHVEIAVHIDDLIEDHVVQDLIGDIFQILWSKTVEQG